jgi:pimeloyl-ACP methyl ester carboxylesterase
VSISANLGEQKEVRLESGVVRYRERGTGEPIVFVHGLLVNGDLWRKVVPLLAGDFRCITPDWPFGSHEAPLDDGVKLTTRKAAGLVRRFLDALELENATLVGNDTGGGLCQIVVSERPERVGRLVLTSCDAFENFPPKALYPLMAAARVPGLPSLLLQSMRIAPLRRLPIAFGWLAKREIPEEIAMGSYLRPSIDSARVRQNALDLIKDISPKHTRRAAEKLPQFKKPVLIAWAEEDRIFPVEDALRLHRVLPNSRLEMVADSYTFVPEDQPERLASLIAKFMHDTAAKPVPAGAESAAEEKQEVK